MTTSPKQLPDISKLVVKSDDESSRGCDYEDAASMDNSASTFTTTPPYTSSMHPVRKMKNKRLINADGKVVEEEGETATDAKQHAHTPTRTKGTRTRVRVKQN